MPHPQLSKKKESFELIKRLVPGALPLPEGDQGLKKGVFKAEGRFQRSRVGKEMMGVPLMFFLRL